MVVLLAWLIVSGWGSLAAAGDKSQSDRVDALFSAIADRTGPGLAVAVVRKDAVVHAAGYGFANLEHEVPITPDTVFDTASVAKPFTGFAVASLIESGAIAPDDAVREHLSQFPGFGHTIAIAHLIHHTSGIRDWPGTLSVAGWRMDDVLGQERILDMAFNQRSLIFDPGTAFRYSNTGYILLAEVVARASGLSFREWLHEHLFAPLEMTRTHVRDDHTEIVPGRASGYLRRPDGSFRRVPNNLSAAGSSSLFSTARDLAAWLMHMNDPQTRDSPIVERMLTRGRLNDGTELPYAYGLFHGTYRGLPTVGHSGGWAGFHSQLMLFPDQRFGVAILANTAIDAERAAHRIADIYLDDRMGPRERGERERPAVLALPKEALELFTGFYRLHDEGQYVRIRKRGDLLTFQPTGEPETVAVAVAEQEFHLPARDTQIAFERNRTGQVAYLLHRDQRLPRVVEGNAPDPDALQEYAGIYESEELRTSYHVTVEDGALTLRHPRHGTIPLSHIRGDDFEGVFPAVTFGRDAEGAVEELRIHVGPRTGDIRFSKRR